MAYAYIHCFVLFKGFHFHYQALGNLFSDDFETRTRYFQLVTKRHGQLL